MNRQRWTTRKVLSAGLCFVLSFATVSAPAGHDRRGHKPQLVLVKAGTRVGTTLPGGWSDLVIKTKPRLVSGDLSSLPSFASTTASMFRSVILADIERSKGNIALRRVGLGL